MSDCERPWVIRSGRSEEMSDSLKKIWLKKSKILFYYVLHKVFWNFFWKNERIAHFRSFAHILTKTSSEIKWANSQPCQKSKTSNYFCFCNKENVMKTVFLSSFLSFYSPIRICRYMSVSMTPRSQIVSMTRRSQTVPMTPRSQTVSMTPRSQTMSMTPRSQTVSMTQWSQTVSIIPRDQICMLFANVC